MGARVRYSLKQEYCGYKDMKNGEESVIFINSDFIEFFNVNNMF